MISWLWKKKKVEQPIRVIVPSVPRETEKSWEKFTSEELVKIAKMLGHSAYGSVDLNFNDVFGYACAWGVEADEFDLVGLAELFEKFGPSGVIAWGAVKEGVEKPIGGPGRFPNFKAAKKEIEANLEKYFWEKRMASSRIKQKETMESIVKSLKAHELSLNEPTRTREGALSLEVKEGLKFGYIEVHRTGEVVYLMDSNGTDRKVWSSEDTNLDVDLKTLVDYIKTKE